MQVGEYYVAGRRVPAFYNGMATGADWMSAASFIGMAGSLYLLGYDGLAFVLGWTGGYVLVAILVAPYLRKFGAYTVPDFLSARYGGNLARFIGVDRAVLLLLHLRGGAGLRHRHHLGALPRHRLQRRRLCRPGRHPGLLDARRHAGGHLDPGRPVHRADHRLPRSGDLDVDRQDRRADSATDVRPGAPEHRRARSSAGDLRRTHHAVRARRLQRAQLLPADPLPDGRHGVAAARPDALLHHAVGARGARFGGLVAALHLHPLLHGAGLCGLRQVDDARPRGVRPDAGEHRRKGRAG